MLLFFFPAFSFLDITLLTTIFCVSQRDPSAATTTTTTAPADAEGHPFSDKWVLRLIQKPRESYPGHHVTQKEYEDRFRHLGSISTAEEFWSIFNFIDGNISFRDMQFDLALFRDGIEPKWEDIENIYGGTMSINCQRNAMESFRHLVCFFFCTQPKTRCTCAWAFTNSF